jgi:hypothetical protein
VDSCGRFSKRFSATYFQAWLAGYRTARPFGIPDEAAVAAFGILGDLRVVAWKLGVAASSRGSPLLAVRDLPAIVTAGLIGKPFIWPRKKPSLSDLFHMPAPRDEGPLSRDAGRQSRKSTLAGMRPSPDNP